MPPKKSPTIYDVARVSGVSITTISRVLNAPDKVNPETHKKVMSAIDKLGFVPKAEARARAMQRTGRIGVLTPFFTAPSFVQRLRGVASILSRSNHELVIYPVDTPEQLQGFLSSIPLLGSLDGLIIMSLFLDRNDSQRLLDKGVETVLIEYPRMRLNSIIIDDVKGGELAAKHLIKKGYKRFGFIGDIEPPERESIYPVRSRLTGFKQTLNDAGISLAQKYIRSAPYTPKETIEAAHDLLSMPNRPDAIFAAADTQAILLIKEARKLNIRVPEDLAVVGFDDIDAADFMDLTTIRQHLDESGRLAAEILLKRLEEPDRPLQHINLPLDLVKRATA